MGSSRAFRRKMAASLKIEDPEEKLAMTCFMHFGDQDPRFITCQTCLDFLQHLCPGEGLHGDECLRCMAKKADNISMGSNF